MRRIQLLLILIFILNANEAISQISTDRPGASDAPTTVMKHSFQIEQGFDMNFYGEDTSQFRMFDLPTAIRVGVFDWLEVRLQNNVISLYDKYHQQNTFGVADLQIGAKIQLFRKEGKKTDVAFVSMWGMPIGTEGLTTNKFSTLNKISVGHAVTDRFSILYNVAYGYYGYGKGQLNYTFLLGFNITPKLFAFIENFGTLDDFSAFTTNADCGFAYQITDWVQVDISYGTGLNNKYNYAQLGVSWNIHKKD
ncbi:MAG: transporter [Crocinitomicaceae bacterium]